jgi:glycosyltransferase involved in cell wall biosynthesis
VLIARLLWEKGIREYVDAARLVKQQHPDSEFLVVGFGEEGNPRYVSSKTLKEWNDEGAITWIGRMADVRPIIARAHCVVLPSFYGEGVPRSLLEGASMGRAVVTTDSVGCREVVDDGVNGYLVKPKNVIDLARAMGRVIEGGGRRIEEMGQKSREKVVNDFNERLVINKYLIEIGRTLGQ